MDLDIGSPLFDDRYWEQPECGGCLSSDAEIAFLNRIRPGWWFRKGPSRVDATPLVRHELAMLNIPTRITRGKVDFISDIYMAVKGNEEECQDALSFASQHGFELHWVEEEQGEWGTPVFRGDGKPSEETLHQTESHDAHVASGSLSRTTAD